MTREEIKEYLNDYLKTHLLKTLSRYITGKKNIIIKEYILRETNYLPNDSKIGERVYHILNDLYEGPICPICKKNISYYRGKYRIYCSSKCSSSSPEVQKKAKQTMLERHGVEHALQSKELQEKSKQTCLERHGVENGMQSDEIKEKQKQTCLENFGYETQCKS